MQAFDPEFRQQLTELMKWRRDVRHFRTDPVPAELLDRCLAGFDLAPSVGLSQPWRVVRVVSPDARAAVRSNFEAANKDALSGYDGERAALYATLKLSGMDRAPEQIAVFCDDATDQGHGLGAGTMPEMRRYSVVCAIMQFWLMARAEGLGVGWVSILDAPRLLHDLNQPTHWALVGYLCVGWPETPSDTPELSRVGWQEREALDVTEC